MSFNEAPAEYPTQSSRAVAPLAPPAGTITLVFTDIEGSSSLWETYRDAFKPVLDAHDALLRDLARQHHGIELRHNGDGFFLSFALASNAVLFAVDAQLALVDKTWEVAAPISVRALAPAETGDALLPSAAPYRLDLRVRMGLHTCEARNVFHPTGAIDYAGAEVNRAARVGAAAHGGQITASGAVVAIAARHLPLDLTFLDLGQHRLKGVGEEHLWQVCGRGLHETFAPLMTQEAPRHNLPQAANPFIGREEWLREAGQILHEPATRLLTVTGFGGMGKTRFALQLAQAAVADYPDGVWWVPLEDAHTTAEMISRIAEQLDLRLQEKPSVEEQLWNFHRQRKLLLVLDNLEQIEPHSDTGRVISGLLNAGAQVKCLATSRRHLGLSSERLFELQPLALAEAEQLFAERARARKANFVLDEHNTEDVRAICRTVDGLPLAVEIAASLIVLLPPRQIVRRLSDRLRTLQMRAPDVPTRHLALRAACDWSYDLLPEPDRLLFQQLSVFVGGFTVEAAETVCESEDVLAGLQELRSGSLLRQTTEPQTQQERLSMLQAVRDYALEKRTESGAHHAAEARHAHYFLQFLRERVEQLRTHQESTVLHEMELEFGNCHAALDWAERHDAACCIESAILFSQALFLRYRWQEAQGVQTQGFRAAERAGADFAHLTPHLVYQAADLAYETGRRAEARGWAQQSLTEFRALGDVTGISNALNLLSVIATDDDDTEIARTYLEEVLQLIPVHNAVVRGKVLHNLARTAARWGDNALTWQLYEESLKFRRQAGDVRGEALTLNNMGTLAHLEGDYARARRLHSKSLLLRRSSGEMLGIAITLNNLGELCIMDGDPARAVGLLLHAQRVFRELQSPWEAEPEQTLATLQQQFGESTYAQLRAAAEASSWESLV